MTTKSADEYLAMLADPLSISETRYEQAFADYASLGAWLHRPESTVLQLRPADLRSRILSPRTAIPR